MNVYTSEPTHMTMHNSTFNVHSRVLFIAMRLHNNCQANKMNWLLAPKTRLNRNGLFYLWKRIVTVYHSYCVFGGKIWTLRYGHFVPTHKYIFFFKIDFCRFIHKNWRIKYIVLFLCNKSITTTRNEKENTAKFFYYFYSFCCAFLFTVISIFICICIYVTWKREHKNTISFVLCMRARMYVCVCVYYILLSLAL